MKDECMTIGWMALVNGTHTINHQTDSLGSKICLIFLSWWLLYSNEHGSKGWTLNSFKHGSLCTIRCNSFPDIRAPLAVQKSPKSQCGCRARIWRSFSNSSQQWSTYHQSWKKGAKFCHLKFSCSSIDWSEAAWICWGWNGWILQDEDRPPKKMLLQTNSN